MSEKLRNLIEEFKSERGKVEANSHRQTKELQSIQKSIQKLASQEVLNEDETTEVSDIINITDEWWCND